MRLHLPHLIQDRQYLRDAGDILLATPVQTLNLPDDGLYLDGPTHPRVAVVDLDAETHRLRPQTRFQRQAVGRTVSAYDLGGVQIDAEAPLENFETEDFLRINPFATVLKTLQFFESKEILGRPVRWAFPSEQLLIVPRAGEMKNAFYDRATGSLQFFHHPAAGGHTVYTALSHDIIVHETTHAVLDGLAPDLYHASNPQSLALHEALADLAAISQTLVNEMIVFSLDSLSSSRVEPLEALSRLAEEFGTDTRLPEGAGFLRRLKNDRGLPRTGAAASSAEIARTGTAASPPGSRPGERAAPLPADPHTLSQVLSGAVYAVFEMRMRNTHRSGDLFAGLEAEFCPAARRVARIVFRALDYLPPGEAGFIDYGRAFLNTAAAAYKRPQLEQRALTEEFVRRGIVGDPAELISTPPKDFRLDPAGIDRFIDDRAALEAFARDHRDALRIPDAADFETLAPVQAHRALKSNPGAKTSRETIFRFRWTETEMHNLGPSLPRTWSTTRGTTLAVDDAGAVRSLLTTSPDGSTGRRALLGRWAAEGRLVPEEAALGPDGRPRSDAVLLKIDGGAARAEGGGRTLHIAMMAGDLSPAIDLE